LDVLFLVFLFVHIGSAIAGFGPTFAFSFLGSMGGSEPMHTNFALRVSQTISDRLVLPMAVVVGISGVGLMWRSGRNPLTELWLLVSIVVYLAALAYSFFVQRRVILQLIEATSGPPPGPPPAPPTAVPPDAAGRSPAGPPPHIAALVRRSQVGGILLLVALVTIVLLMVFKPF
jgi:uncharacterized membrane protein